MKNRKMKILIAAVLLVALAAPAAVLAYFTDYEDAYGGAVIELKGETTIHEDANSEKKVISIENVGDTDVIVRLAIYGDYVKQPLTYETSSEWIEDGDWIYYKKILAPGESTSKITAFVDAEAAEAAGHDFDIVVVHESERVSYDGTADNKVVLPDGWTYPNISAGMTEEVGN